MKELSANQDDLSFESWVRHVFDHLVSKPEWYFADRTEPWADERAMVLGYMTRLFEAPEFLLSTYGRPQVGEGLWFLASSIASGYMWFLHDTHIPWSIRYRTISSIPMLFERLFAMEWSDTLGHLDQKGDDLLAMTCYMWWNIFPTVPDRPEARLTDALLGAMASILSLPSEGCKESALHGLGHEESRWPEQVRELVDHFLDEQPDISPELKRYALGAREGGIL
jgi:hypothetical protein